MAEKDTPNNSGKDLEAKQPLEHTLRSGLVVREVVGLDLDALFGLAPSGLPTEPSPAPTRPNLRLIQGGLKKPRG